MANFIYHKIRFNSGSEIVGLDGYQILDASYTQVRITDLDGVDLALPVEYSYDFVEPNAPAPSWGS